jgi:hypothetical protein
MREMEAGANDDLPRPILHHDPVARIRAILASSSGQIFAVTGALLHTVMLTA